MRIQVSVGRGAKKTDSLVDRVGLLKLTAEWDGPDFDEFQVLARLFRLVDKYGIEIVVKAAEGRLSKKGKK